MIYDGNTNVFGRNSGDQREHISIFLLINWKHNMNWLRWRFNCISYIRLCTRNNRFKHPGIYFSIKLFQTISELRWYKKKQICIPSVYLRMQVWFLLHIQLILNFGKCINHCRCSTANVKMWSSQASIQIEKIGKTHQSFSGSTHHHKNENNREWWFS